MILSVLDTSTATLLRVVRQQMFVNAPCAVVNQTAVLIVTKQDQPLEHAIGPFAARQQVFGICSERAKEGRDVRVTPTNENPLPLLRCTQVIGEFSRLIIAKTRVDSQFFCFREWLDRETGPV